MNDNEKYEYFSKYHKIWKPVLISDNIKKLKECHYEIRLKGSLTSDNNFKILKGKYPKN